MQTDTQSLADPQFLATVTICTRDRSASLSRTLDSIKQAARGVDLPWELLVVDNGSSDDTQDVVRKYAEALPIRSIVQEIPGLSNARNAGLAQARGKFIIWTDDDVEVDSGWLNAYLQTFAHDPQEGIFGGRIVPRYLEPVTQWFAASEEHLYFLLAMRNSPEVTEVADGFLPFGANFAVRTDVQRRFTYDVNLGVAPGRRLGGEETSMIKDALAKGVTGCWVWDSTVYHLIPPERQTKAYMFQYYRTLGYSHPKVSLEPGLYSRAKAHATLGLRALRKGAMAHFRRAAGNAMWVPSYTEYARTIGAFDRLRGRLPS